MGRKLQGLLAGVLGISMLLGSMGAAGAEGTKDYEGHWAQKTIEQWLSSGNLKGFQDGSVKPNQSITRAEFMTLVNRSFGFSEIAKVSFSDVASSSWISSEVAKAVAAGYIQGFNNEMRPNDSINRQEAAVMISKLLKLELGATDNLKVFNDAGQIAVWAKTSVAAAVKAGLLKGYPNGSFAPVQALTRAESLTLIDHAAEVVQPASTSTPAVTPSPSPTATATAAVGGGGAGTGGGAAPTAVPTVAPTSAPTAAPATTPTPTPNLPVSDIPILNVHISASPNAKVTNAVYLEFDYSAVPTTAIDYNTYATYYVTATPITSRDLKWELGTRRSVITLPSYLYLATTHVGVNVPSQYVPAGGDYYVTVVFRKQDQAVGYYSQKINLQPSHVSSPGNLVKLESGVAIEQRKQTFNININGGDHYSDVIDVTYALEKQSGKAVYYTISPRYISNIDNKYEVDDIVTFSRNLYTDKVVRVIDTNYPVSERTDQIPLAFESLQNNNTYNEQEYTIIFYDKDLQALSYYQGKVNLSNELAIDAVNKRIDDIQGYPALDVESAIIKASRAYSALTDAQKAFISQSRTTKLETALDQLETMKHSGPLGNSLSLVSGSISNPSMKFNGTTLSAYSAEFPYNIRNEVATESFYITDNPVTSEELAVPSKYGKLPYSGMNYLPVAGLTGNHYVTVVFYDKNGNPLRYLTQQKDFTITIPTWDGSAVEVHEGLTLERGYSNGSRSDYVIFENYVKAHPEAVYVTANSKSDFGMNQSFTPEHAVQQLNEYGRTSSYPFFRMSYVTNEALTGMTEDYIIVFYDKNFKAISYYLGSLAD